MNVQNTGRWLLLAATMTALLSTSLGAAQTSIPAGIIDEGSGTERILLNDHVLGEDIILSEEQVQALPDLLNVTGLKTWSSSNGTPFLESVNPLERFERFIPVDEDGDGDVDLPTLQRRSESDNIPSAGTLPLAQDIQRAMTEAGATVQDIADAWTMVLGENGTNNPALPDLLAVLEEQGPLPAITMASAIGLVDLQFKYLCGSSTFVYETDAWIGLPTFLHCSSPVATTNILAWAIPTYIRLTGTDLAGMDLTILSGDTQLGSRNGAFGIKIANQNAALYTRISDLQRMDLVINGLASGSFTLDATITKLQGTIASGNFLVYSPGYNLYTGSVVYLDFDRSTTSFGLDIATSPVTNGFQALVSVSSTYYLDTLRAEIDAGPGKDVVADLVNFPSSMLIRYQKTTGSVGGDIIEVSLDHGSGNFAMGSMELQGTFTDTAGNSNPFDFQIVGFPADNTLRIRPGVGATGCGVDSPRTKSVDLHADSSSSGYYRTILVEGESCDRDQDLTGSYLRRARLEQATDDQWDSNDNDHRILLGANLYSTSLAIWRLDSVKSWSPDIHNYLKYHSSTLWKHHKDVGLSTHTGTHSYGVSFKYDGSAVNSYFTGFTSTQMTSCYDRYSDGTCP